MTPAEIAAKMTPAQKRALMWLPSDGSVRMLGQTPPSVAAREWLRAMDLMQAPTPNHRRLTPLGLAVRAVLEAQGDA